MNEKLLVGLEKNYLFLNLYSVNSLTIN